MTSIYSLVLLGMDKLTCPIASAAESGFSHSVESFEFGGGLYHVNLAIDGGTLVYAVFLDVPESAESGLMLDVSDRDDAQEIAKAAAELTSIWQEHSADAAEYAAEAHAWIRCDCYDESLAP